MEQVMSMILKNKRFNKPEGLGIIKGLMLVSIVALCLGITSGFSQVSSSGSSYSKTTITNWLNFEPGEEYTLEGSGTFIPNVSTVKHYEAVADFFRFFDNSSNSLGVRLSWDRVGNHYADIVPKVTQDKADAFPVEDVVKISLWVWSPGYKHELAAIFKRLDGYVYSLHLTKLDFKGWRNVEVNIPLLLKSKVNAVDVSQKYYFDRLRVYTQPYEKVGDIYVFIDKLDATRELFASIYDGLTVEEIIRQEMVEENLKKEEQQSAAQ